MDPFWTTFLTLFDPFLDPFVTPGEDHVYGGGPGGGKWGPRTPPGRPKTPKRGNSDRLGGGPDPDLAGREACGKPENARSGHRAVRRCVPAVGTWSGA